VAAAALTGIESVAASGQRCPASMPEARRNRCVADYSSSSIGSSRPIRDAPANGDHRLPRNRFAVLAECHSSLPPLAATACRKQSRAQVKQTLSVLAPRIAARRVKDGPFAPQLSRRELRIARLLAAVAMSGNKRSWARLRTAGGRSEAAGEASGSVSDGTPTAGTHSNSSDDRPERSAASDDPPRSACATRRTAGRTRHRTGPYSVARPVARVEAAPREPSPAPVRGRWRSRAPSPSCAKGGRRAGESRRSAPRPRRCAGDASDPPGRRRLVPPTHYP